MAAPEPTLVITGASGYIGRALVDHARAGGWRVRVLGRRSVVGVADADLAPFDLARPLEDAARAMLEQATAVIHLAADTLGSDLNDRAEVVAAVALLEAVAPGTPLILVSSQSAGPDAPSAYGRRKFALEQRLGPLGAILVRPGLVYGGPPRGLYGRLCGLVERSRVLPRLSPEPMVRPVHIDDLCAALLALATERNVPGRPIGLAEPAPVPFSLVLRWIADAQRGRTPIFVPLPAPMARTAARLMPGRTSEQLASLLALPGLPDDGGLGVRSGLEFAPMSPARCVWAPAARRRLLAEGAALIAHASGARPPAMALRRYVRGCLTQGLAPLPGATRSLRLAAWLNDPPLLRRLALDHPASAAIQARLRMAMIVAEACPALADRFLWAAGRGRGPAVLAIGLALAGEGLRLGLTGPWLVARALLRRLLTAR